MFELLLYPRNLTEKKKQVKRGVIPGIDRKQQFWVFYTQNVGWPVIYSRDFSVKWTQRHTLVTCGDRCLPLCCSNRSNQWYPLPGLVSPSLAKWLDDLIKLWCLYIILKICHLFFPLISHFLQARRFTISCLLVSGNWRQTEQQQGCEQTCWKMGDHWPKKKVCQWLWVAQGENVLSLPLGTATNPSEEIHLEEDRIVATSRSSELGLSLFCLFICLVLNQDFL